MGDGDAGMSRRAFRNHIIQRIIFNKSREVTQSAKEKPVVEPDFKGRTAAVTIYCTPKVDKLNVLGALHTLYQDIQKQALDHFL